ncbi:TIGR04222 domain-containing membrane protein [Amycolatopsis sp. EV170708-02-1]|uniref:TIGR04222 domain-containing membrane protein n=1 Tax=Amycolatopsis sp. EV170708-02-1 TaxID=2919322 RepID=UPI001F0C539F|nr:TIGR04222 domain-containing membrane protein [Amycolatopsis sp. EV170708-02-1]UMP03965.1 TIGR04222 domain-containing membrane protein [Amycolatopsis sp. EV170708-02-1]
MNEPWGISGPAFAWLYGVCAVLPFLVAGLWTHSLRRRAADERTPPSPYHLAALAGGTERVADVAVATMVAGEQIRLDSRGRVTVLRAASGDPLTRAAAELVPRAGDGGLYRLKKLLSRSAAVQEVRNDLQLSGLQVDERRRRTGWLVALIVYLPVLALGLARLANAIPLGRPVGVLTGLLLAVVAAIAGTALLQRPSRTVLPTLAGLGVIGAARRNPLLVPGVAGAVALGGLAAYPDPVMADVLVRTGDATAKGSAGSSGSGSGCANGSSCGGGGGCGG